MKKGFWVLVEGKPNISTGFERFFPQGWQETVSNLPPEYQELPLLCRENAGNIFTKAISLVDYFPRYPITSQDLAGIHSELEGKASDLALVLDSFNQKRAYKGCSSYGAICARAINLLVEEVARTNRERLVTSLQEMVLQNMRDRLSRDLNPALLAQCSEITDSFVNQSLAWAMVSDRPGFKENFPISFLPIYRLGATGVDFGKFRQEQLLIARFPFIHNGQIGSKFLAVALKGLLTF